MPAPLVSVGLISAAVLGYQLLLMRLFSIVYWHHFAYMMISLALLGYGVSGTVVALWRERLSRHFPVAFVINAALFGLAQVAAFEVAQRVPFNALEILWDARQPLFLLLLYGLLFVPFFFAGNCICLSFVCCNTATHRLYGADLLGAAGGCLLVMALLFLLPPLSALRVIAALGLLAAAVGAWRLRLGPRLAAVLLALALALPFALPAPVGTPVPNEYKSLSRTLQIGGARVLEERSSPLGHLTVVESPRVPFRHAPGLSLNAAGEPPAQLGVFTDGEGFAALTRFDGDFGKLAYLDMMTSALPYHLLEAPHVLVLGAGSGADVLQALSHEARRVEAVELNAQMVDLVRDRHAGFAGDVYRRPEVQVHVAEARGFVAASQERYDLIQVALLDAFGASSAGLYGLSESYLYTVEALQDYLRHLRPGGLLSITRWVSLPPRDALKLFGTAVVALEHEGVAQPGNRLALVRGWQTVTLLVRNGEFGAEDVARIRAFSDARSFDTEWAPGIAAGETNRFNRLDQPWFHEGATALLGEGRAQFIERYKFNIAPATDDRPYFFNFFRWRTFPEILALKGRGGLPLLELGYPVLVATLGQALLASTLLILLPLSLGRAQPPAVPRTRVFAYFAALGFGFMFIEIAFIQKFTLLLPHPLYAVAVVLCAFLLFAGLGSRYSERLQGGVWRPVLAILPLAASYLLLLPWLLRSAVALPDALKIPLAVALIAPLAFCMGMPFPRGLAALASHSPSAVPWAYGINACTSVIGAVLATLLAIHLGFSGVIVLAAALYGLAAMAFPNHGGGAASTIAGSGKSDNRSGRYGSGLA